MTAEEERCARVDAKLTEQLRRSIELNARMVTRLQKYARQIVGDGVELSPKLTAADLIDISHDKDPWI